LAGLWGWLSWEQIPDRWSLLGSVLVIAGGLLTIYLASVKTRGSASIEQQKLGEVLATGKFQQPIP
jgi:hypothetical protein